MKKHITVLTGAGISADSGLGTFRAQDGLWDKYHINDVASIDGYFENKQYVLDFYNTRRKEVLEAEPNEAHRVLVELERIYDVDIVTTNVDDLHERAGSSSVLHLHGEILKTQSENDATRVYDLEGDELNLGDKDIHGEQLRPNVVWFGEPVPNIVKAIDIFEKTDLVIVVGSSMSVYPASSLCSYITRDDVMVYNVNPEVNTHISGLSIQSSAVLGVPKLVKNIIDKGF